MFRIVKKEELNPSVVRMEIKAPLAAKKAKAGQFIILRVNEEGERSPLTVAGYDRDNGTVCVIFQIVGFRTADLVILEKELPARAEEVEHAKEEGIHFMMLTNPIGVLGDNGAVIGVRCQQMVLSEPDESGRAKPIPKEGCEVTIGTDCVIMAIGTSPNPLIKTTTAGLEVNKHGGIIVEETTGKTSKDSVYAGGDAVTGAATVILAMGAGKVAAKAIDEAITEKQ